jgi:hypothetical protein
MRKNTFELMVASVCVEPDEIPFGSLSPRTSIAMQKRNPKASAPRPRF